MAITIERFTAARMINLCLPTKNKTKIKLVAEIHTIERSRIDKSAQFSF